MTFCSSKSSKLDVNKFQITISELYICVKLSYDSQYKSMYKKYISLFGVCNSYVKFVS